MLSRRYSAEGVGREIEEVCATVLETSRAVDGTFLYLEYSVEIPRHGLQKALKTINSCNDSMDEGRECEADKINIREKEKRLRDQWTSAKWDE